MIMITGYVHEVGDRDDGVTEVVFDIGGDAMLTITHLDRNNVREIAQHLGNMITLTWCGSQVTIGKVPS
jgi:hypothetical protein